MPLTTMPKAMAVFAANILHETVNFLWKIADFKH
jgi:hypothetical protein